MNNCSVSRGTVILIVAVLIHAPEKAGGGLFSAPQGVRLPINTVYIKS